MRDDKLWARGSHALGWDGRSGRGHHVRTGSGDGDGDGGCLQGEKSRRRFRIGRSGSCVARCAQEGVSMLRGGGLRGGGTVLQ